jgi:hypothetical protein
MQVKMILLSLAQLNTNLQQQDGKDVITRVAPGMRLDLNAAILKLKLLRLRL